MEIQMKPIARATLSLLFLLPFALQSVDCFTVAPSNARSWAKKASQYPSKSFTGVSSFRSPKAVTVREYHRSLRIRSNAGAENNTLHRAATSVTSMLLKFSARVKPTNSKQIPKGQNYDPIQESMIQNAAEPEAPLLLDGIPSYKTMILFISTTILIWLSEPLLSLVDTTVVGRYSNVLQLAALGPATMLMDSAIYLTYFLAIATTNTVANGLAKQEYQQLQTSTSQVLGLATVLGTMLTATMFVAGKPLLRWAAGGSSSPELIQLALHYCQIRSLVAPMAIVGMVAQSVCLASLDTSTPAIAVAVASVVNVLGDIVLVPHFGMAGAAAATAAASASAALLLLRQTRRTMMHWRKKVQEEAVAASFKRNGTLEDVFMEMSISGSEDGAQSEASIPPPIPLWSLPNPTAFASLLWKTGPIFFCIVGKIICYSALSIRATDFGVTALAAHNVMIRVFFLYATFGDSLSQASQTFVPRVLIPLSSGRRQRNSSVTKLLRRLTILAAVIGVTTKLLAQLVLTNFGSSFTRDASILTVLTAKNTAHWAGWALLLHPFIMLLEGCLLASQDLVFLLGSYAVTMACHFLSLRLGALSFPGVWRALFFFQTFRLLQFSWRIWNQLLLRETEIPTSATTTMNFVET